MILDEIIEPAPEDFTLSKYYRAVFHMYDTDEPEQVALLCENHVMKAIIDNFGLEADTEMVDETHFRANLTVCTSPTFYRWVFGWCGAVKILEPVSGQNEYKKMLRRALKDQTIFQ